MAAEIAKPIVRASEVQIGEITIPLGKIQTSCLYTNTHEVRVWTIGGMGLKNKEVVLTFALQTAEKAHEFFLNLQKEWQKEKISGKSLETTQVDKAEVNVMEVLITQFASLRSQVGPEVEIKSSGCFYMHQTPHRISPPKNSLSYSVALDGSVNRKEIGEETFEPLRSAEGKPLDELHGLLQEAVKLARIVERFVPRLSQEAGEYATCVAHKLEQFPPKNLIEIEVSSNLVMVHPMEELTPEEDGIIQSQLSQNELADLEELTRKMQGESSILESIPEDEEIS